ncbi:MAG: helix-turn-helix domain-containing protein [Chloroflexota bacterium]|nr:helix-turn-helix domain-containing protein [Chloroflexota bacterium]
MDKERVLPRLLVRVEEAARLCSISRSLMYELVAAGEVPSLCIGRSRRIPLDGLQAWIETQTGPDGEAAELPAVGPEELHPRRRAHHGRGTGR